jgi:hypothetical protein
MTIILAAIAINVAAGQVSPLNTTLSTITTPTYSAATVSIWSIMLLIFGVFVLMKLAESMNIM